MNHQPSLQMEDTYEDLPSLYAREEDMVSAAQHVVKLLGTHRHANDHLKQLLADLDTELAAMKLLESNKAKELNEIKDRLTLAERKIKAWISDPGTTWESCPDLFSDFLKSVDEVHRLAEYSRTLSFKEKTDSEEIIGKAENVLQIAMTRIEEELRDIFAHSLQSFLSNMPSSCCEEEVADRGSFISDESLLGSSRRESSSSSSDHYVGDFNLVCPDSIPVIQSISRLMFSAKYKNEFLETFAASQKEALDELLLELGFKRFTIEELMKMDWKVLDGKIKTWIHAVRIFVQVYLVGVKRLCEQVFEEVEPTDPALFANIASSTMTCLLSFGQGVAMGARKPEKLFALLNMVEVLSQVSQEVFDLLCEETASSVIMELKELANSLGCSAKATFLEFGEVVLSVPSVEPFHAGQIHHLTKYVMNYLNTLPAYHNILNNLILDGSDVLLIDSGSIEEEEEEESIVNDVGSLQSCLMAIQIRSIADKLEMNLENKSQLYKDGSLKHVFLLNNTHYIVQKARDSDLRSYLGDDWIRKRMSNCKSHATGYIRTSWSPIVPLLLDEASSGSSPGSSRTTIIKEKMRSFASAFEDVYKIQSGWIIRDHQLKQELKISITQTLVPAYQGFVIRCKNHNLEKYVKYEADDLVDLIQDLFEGSVKSLSSNWRR